MSTLIFVHGISVRDPGYEAVLPWLRDGLERIRPSMKLRFCFWGDVHGADLRADGMSIPKKNRKTRGSEKSGDDAAEEEARAAWARLAEDPASELRALAAAAPRPRPVPLGEVPPAMEVIRRAQALEHQPVVASILAAQGLAAQFGPAVTVVLDLEVTRRALTAAGELGGALNLALARAIVAVTLIRAGGGSIMVPIPGDLIDDLIDQVCGELGGVDKAGLLVRAAVRVGSWYATHHRERLTRTAVPVIGDVACYLTHGAAIRELIAAAVSEESGPVCLLGHSLGGVACVDLLATRSIPAVDLLLTVGSQSSYLYEIDALPSLRFGEPLPQSVPRWINVYDPSDLLSFVGEGTGLFPGRVADRVVENRVPFPQSHQAYFRNKRFYELLDEVLP